MKERTIRIKRKERKKEKNLGCHSCSIIFGVRHRLRMMAQYLSRLLLLLLLLRVLSIYVFYLFFILKFSLGANE